MKQQLLKGFTVVELLIVIVVIAILASVTIVMYGSTQDQAEYTSAQSDMKHINDAITVFRAQKGVYPGTATSFQNTATSLTQLVNEGYLDSASVLTASSGYSYQYRTDVSRANYSLIRIVGSSVANCAASPSSKSYLPKVEIPNNKLLKNSGTCPGAFIGSPDPEYRSWGYWSTGAASW